MERTFLIFLFALSVLGCNYEDVPPTHRGRVFEAAWLGESNGFIGDILTPGTHNLHGIQNSLHLVQCGEMTVREALEAPSKNGVVFGAEVFVRFTPNCEPNGVEWILDNVRPSMDEGNAPTDDPDYFRKTVTSAQLFNTYIRPSLGMAVRDAFSAVQSDEVNLKRQDIAVAVDQGLRQRLGEVSKDKVRIVNLAQVDLSSIGFPESMKATMEQLANVKTEVELEKERERKVHQEIQTELKQKELATARAQKSATEIDEIGEAVRRNPEYLTYLQAIAQSKATQEMPAALGKLGATQGTVILGEGSMNMFIPQKGGK